MHNKNNGKKKITGTISVLRSSARPACNPETDGELKNEFLCTILHTTVDNENVVSRIFFIKCHASNAVKLGQSL